jgi:hypothetical protein
VSTLIRDDNLAVRTLFPLLAHYGWERPFRDERGWLIQRPEIVVFIVDEVADVFLRLGNGPETLSDKGRAPHAL